ncbi:hypothetical protein [Vibrio campbellii]|uniref:hypothetical protein n=1 Tax=Vibrio campbellii TaxID=680 RepID=UPI0021086DB7|nr:hypothetical protein [Vibrio campbellii]UTZ40250.1 hypothetical protein HB764_01915 [Vibrio campbellii]
MLKTKLMIMLGGLIVSSSCFASSESLIEDAMSEESRELAYSEEHCEGKGFDGRLLLENEPTKQVLSSIESISKTLNAMSILMSAGDKT